MVYQYIKQIDGKSLFFYIIIFIICLLYFNNKNITLSTILGIIIAITLIYTINEKNTIDQTNKDVQHDVKLNSIHPKPTYLGDYREITDFVFTIQDFYMYNPPVFEEMILFIDKFLGVYKEIILDPTLAGVKYEILNTAKTNAVNALHSIIYSLPANKQIIEKHHIAIETLNQLLDVYLNNVYKANDAITQIHGYKTNTVILNIDEKPYNSYEKNIFTYEFI